MPGRGGVGRTWTANDRGTKTERFGQEELLCLKSLQRRPVEADGDQAVPGHNRWHPDIPVAVAVKTGSEFRVECREWTDAQLGDDDSANDVRDVDLERCHMLSGPIEVEGAEPGDLLVVDILDLGPAGPAGVRQRAGPGMGLHGYLRQGEWRGLLTDHFPDAYKAIWDFRGQDATLAAYARSPLHRYHAPWPVRDRPVR